MRTENDAAPSGTEAVEIDIGADLAGPSAFLELSQAQRADLFYHAFQDAPDGLVIVAPDGAILYANTQAELLFGYRAAELVDRLVEMLLPVHMRRGHVADRTAYVTHPVSRPMGRGVPLYGRRKNGTEFAAEIALSPIDYNGEVYVIAAVRNAGEWIRMETIESRLHQPPARLMGVRQARAAIDRATEDALDDLTPDLVESRPSNETPPPVAEEVEVGEAASEPSAGADS